MPYNLPLLLLPLLGGFVFTKNWYRTYEGKAIDAENARIVRQLRRIHQPANCIARLP